MSKEVKQVLKKAMENGWSVVKTNGQHYKLTHPSGALVFASSTPRDYHAIANMEADMRRALRQAQASGGRRHG